MDKNELKGQWNIAKGKVKEKWGELTDDQIDQIDGEKDQLVGAIQKQYGKTLDEARREVEEWRAN